jgi:hypothetical protein
MTYIYERKQAGDLFHDLKTMGRDNFSYDGAKALMEYLEGIAEDTGEPIEYDPISFCCDFAEYDSIDDYNKAYDTQYSSWSHVGYVVAMVDDIAIVENH